MVAVVGVGGRKSSGRKGAGMLARPGEGARFGDGVLRQFIGLEEDLAALDFDLELGRTALVRRCRLATAQIDGPVVQRAGDAVAKDHALRELPALVWAAV